jgi:hypothetical protein
MHRKLAMQAAKQNAKEIPQMTVALARAGAGLSVFFLALGFALSGLWPGTAAILAVGALWLLGHLRPTGQLGALRWTSSAAFAMLVIGAAVAMWMSVWAGWPLLGLVAALATWDLDQFARQMRIAGRVDDGPGLERRHIQRLLIVAAIGCLLAAVGLVLRLRLSFGLALLLAALAMLGLSLIVGYMRRMGD